MCCTSGLTSEPAEPSAALSACAGMTEPAEAARSAVLYRMVLPDHTCPHGVAAKEMLEKAGYTVEDNVLSSREEVDAYKAKEGVDTTPQVFIDGKRIGGAEALAAWLAKQGDASSER